MILDNLIKICICRLWTSDEGTGGVLILPSGVFCNTLELPWRDNQRKLSCIPLGEYLVQWDPSPKYGFCYELRDVPDRSTILIHSGNLAGDTEKGLKTHTQGCILLGKWFGYINGQRSIKSSRPTISQFHEFTNKQDFILVIETEEVI